MNERELLGFTVMAIRNAKERLLKLGREMDNKAKDEEYSSGARATFAEAANCYFHAAEEVGQILEPEDAEGKPALVDKSVLVPGSGGRPPCFLLLADKSVLVPGSGGGPLCFLLLTEDASDGDIWLSSENHRRIISCIAAGEWEEEAERLAMCPRWEPEHRWLTRERAVLLPEARRNAARWREWGRSRT